MKIIEDLKNEIVREIQNITTNYGKLSNPETKLIENSKDLEVMLIQDVEEKLNNVLDAKISLFVYLELNFRANVRILEF